MIPIFVVDRPASLQILSGIRVSKNSFGILSHALTSQNFKMKFKEFDLTSYKIGDSGIYQKSKMDYGDLFSEYEAMGCSHGIIKDYYRERKKTFESAKKAVQFRKRMKPKFQLVGVAQGATIEEYVESYAEQKNIGIQIIAIGGLLTKVEKHKRMVRISNESYLKEVIGAINKEFPDDKLFPLGAFRKKRIQFFNEMNVWASDYKGWIFKYDVEESHIKGNRFAQVRDYISKNILPVTSEKNRLLILACSKSKNTDSMKALDLYNGPAFRMVRKYLLTSNHLDVRVLSAKYGLIRSDTIITPYDLKLNEERASELMGLTRSKINNIMKQYDDVFVFGGKLYQEVIGKHLHFQYSHGKIGQQLASLNDWLYSPGKGK